MVHQIQLRLVLVGLAFLCFSGLVLAVPLGTNVIFHEDWTTDIVFVDAMKEARGWLSHGSGWAVVLRPGMRGFPCV